MQPGNSHTRGIFTYSYPHTVENGARERIIFVQRVQDPAGDRLEFENHLKLGSWPPINIHNHHRMREGVASLFHTWRTLRTAFWAGSAWNQHRYLSLTTPSRLGSASVRC